MSGTMYFDKTGSKLFAVGGTWLTSMTAVIPSPFAIIVRMYPGTLTTEAGIAVSQGSCFKLRSYGNGGSYTGGFCR